MADNVLIKSKSLKELEREITCGICQEHFTEPKILPCYHCYCKQCIVKLALRTDTGQPFSCPECRNKTVLPDGGVDELKTAFHINRIKATVTAIDPHHREKCDKNTCPKCELKPQIACCFKGESLKYHHYTMKEHHGYDLEFSNVSAPAVKEKLVEKLRSLKKQKENLTQIICSIQTTKQKIAAEGEDVATHITKSFKRLHEMFDKHEQELLQNIAGVIHKKIVRLSAEEENLSVARAEIQHVVEYTEQGLRQCTDNDAMSVCIEQNIADLGVEVRCGDEELQHICQTQADIPQQPVDPTKCTLTVDIAGQEVGKPFTAVLVTRFSNNLISIQHHVISCFLRSLYNVCTQCQVDLTGAGQYSIQYTPVERGRHELTVLVDGKQIAGSPFPLFVSIHPIQLGDPVKVWTNFCYPTGITVNTIGEVLVCGADGSIIKLDRDGNKIILAHQVKSGFQRTLINTMNSSITLSILRKVEADDANNIYCVSNNSDTVFRCDQNGDNIQVKIIPHVDGGCNGLALAGDEVMICGKDNGGTLRVYDKELNYKRSIEQNNIGNISDIAADCHGNLYCTDFLNDCVHVISIDGVLMHSFGCDNNGEKKLNEPKCLCVSGDYVYVCNHGIHHISVFTTDGLYVTSFGHCHRPHSMCVDKDGFLYVTDVSCHTLQLVQIF